MGLLDNDIFHPGRWGTDIGNAFGTDTNDRNNAAMDQARANINAQGAALNQFAGQLQGNYAQQNAALNGTYGQLGDAMNYLRGIGQGQNSVSAMQLQQGLQQNLAAQRAMAAGAAPQNAAMAARTAARNQASLGYGLAGQQALAGLQERNQAWSQYGNLGSALGQLQLGARGQDLGGAINARGQAIGGYGQVLNGRPDQNWVQANGQVLQGLGSAIAAA